MTAMIWRSRARVLLLLRSTIPRSPPPPPPPHPTPTLTRFSPPRPLSRFLSSSPDPIPYACSSAAADPFPEAFSSPTEVSQDATEAGEDNLSSMWEEAGDADDIFASPGGADAVADDEEVARVCAAVESTPEDKIASTLADMIVDFNEPLLAAVLLAAEQCSCKKLISLFNYAAKNNPAAKNLSNLEILVSKVADSDEIDKTDAYLLWDSIKEIGLCQDHDSYYLVIEAARKKSMFRSVCEVCEKMIGSACFPNREKTGRILTYLCEGKKLLEEYQGESLKHAGKSFATVVHALCRVNKMEDANNLLTRMVQLEEYQGESLKNAGNTFATVIHGLCRKKKLEDAKTLLMRMVNVGPAPALSKQGEMENAKDLMRVMESQGISPDIYTYSVLMSGYIKGGMISEAHDLLREAKKVHPKLNRVAYHILIRGYCKMEDFEKAIECLKEMRKDGLLPNVDEYDKLIQSLCLKAMDWRRAEKLLEEMEDSGLCLRGISRSLIAAVKELEGEEMQSKASQEA
ncbi:unnamed protein product [Miscanthus lutarioriparius]|uniref:Pentatricopeptide repeat-containing protein n=1 Tax=Miscanthus lutarioriparius TaxID=422564 RepID=A0A811NXA6_9POAL|nr:unnamed protein product [Miscanthus lutarioriparius]